MASLESERRGFGKMDTSFGIIYKNDNVAGFGDFCSCHDYVTEAGRRKRSREDFGVKAS
jgi:hypothetical protein